MKRCSKCKIEKEENCFWKRNNRKSGINSECKDCCKIRRQQNYKDKNDEFKLKRKIYYHENQEKLLNLQIESQKGNARYRKYQNIYSIKKRKEGDQRFLARSIVCMALKGRMIFRPENCSKCNLKIKVEAHHEDYTKPLDVIWLCRECHLNLHRQKRKKLQKEIG